jgi:hypothetical protein
VPPSDGQFRPGPPVPPQPVGKPSASSSSEEAPVRPPLEGPLGRDGGVSWQTAEDDDGSREAENGLGFETLEAAVVQGPFAEEIIRLRKADPESSRKSTSAEKPAPESSRKSKSSERPVAEQGTDRPKKSTSSEEPDGQSSKTLMLSEEPDTEADEKPKKASGSELFRGLRHSLKSPCCG